MSKAKVYAIYDTKYYEQCVRIGTIKEIADFLNCSTETVRCGASRRRNGRRKNLLKSRYEIVELVEDNNDNENNIFQNLINAFMPPRIKFKEFDPFKWKLKRIKG